MIFICQIINKPEGNTCLRQEVTISFSEGDMKKKNNESNMR